MIEMILFRYPRGEIEYVLVSFFSRPIDPVLDSDSQDTDGAITTSLIYRKWRV